MLIGEDFEKIAFRFLEMDLLEPNAFIGDLLLFVIALYFGFRTFQLNRKNKSQFLTYWIYFFFIFSLGFLSGGFGHLMYNYWGVEGKFMSWYMGIFSASCIEMAMTVFFTARTCKKLRLYILIKLLTVLTAHTIIILDDSIYEFPTRGMLLPTIHSSVALITSLGVFGYIFSKKISTSFRYFFISVLVLFPSVIFQAFKINFSPWFDRNDAGHILLIISLFLYFKGVRETYESVILKD